MDQNEALLLLDARVIKKGNLLKDVVRKSTARVATIAPASSFLYKKNQHIIFWLKEYSNFILYII